VLRPRNESFRPPPSVPNPSPTLSPSSWSYPTRFGITARVSSGEEGAAALSPVPPALVGWGPSPIRRPRTLRTVKAGVSVRRPPLEGRGPAVASLRAAATLAVRHCDSGPRELGAARGEALEGMRMRLPMVEVGGRPHHLPTEALLRIFALPSHKLRNLFCDISQNVVT